MNLFTSNCENFSQSSSIPYLSAVWISWLTITGFLLIPGIGGHLNTTNYEKPIVIVTSKPLIVKGPYIENCKTLRFEAHIFPLPCKKYNVKCGNDKNQFNCDSFKVKHKKNCDKIKLSKPNLYLKLCSNNQLVQQ
ncbi:uncharacterized protein LOC128388709 [Panonychus citri]|uniref:uncharacterized protein LOC128388709 n=1 Tax=Panonychus citri TaxID=50023 RepID=UPI002306F39D|nr:uncharacterized protein LOC128388709 [Panonychus citri]